MGKEPIAIAPGSILSAFDEISAQTGLKSFVVFGSSSTIIYNKHRSRSLPDFMKKTVDVDISTTFQGQSVEIYDLEMKALGTITKNFGEKTPFHQKNDFYFELVSREFVRMAPFGWEDRAKIVTTEKGTELKVLNPIDCASLKLEAGREKDIEWLANGFASKLFSPRQLENHVTGHSRYQESKARIAETLKVAVSLGKKLSQNRERD